jgi:hypothetical protein
MYVYEYILIPFYNFYSVLSVIRNNDELVVGKKTEKHG